MEGTHLDATFNRAEVSGTIGRTTEKNRSQKELDALRTIARGLNPDYYPKETSQCDVCEALCDSEANPLVQPEPSPLLFNPRLSLWVCLPCKKDFKEELLLACREHDLYLSASTLLSFPPTVIVPRSSGALEMWGLDRRMPSLLSKGFIGRIQGEVKVGKVGDLEGVFQS
jgi:hypothetical protein